MTNKLIHIFHLALIVVCSIGMLMAIKYDFDRQSGIRELSARCDNIINEQVALRKKYTEKHQLWIKMHMDFYGPCVEPCHMEKQSIINYDRECQDCH